MTQCKLMNMAMAAALIVTVELAPHRAIASCPPEPQVIAVIGVEHRQPVVQSNYSIRQLSDLATQMGYRGPHAPLGFYTGTLGYQLDVEIGALVDNGCLPTYYLRVNFALAARLVEVGRDLPCDRDIVVAHYLTHASQDDLLLRRYGELARGRFDDLLRTLKVGHYSVATLKTMLLEASRRVLDELLIAYDRERKQSLAAADTTEELERLRRACRRSI